jgi:hypothetical protein
VGSGLCCTLAASGHAAEQHDGLAPGWPWAFPAGLMGFEPRLIAGVTG